MLTNLTGVVLINRGVVYGAGVGAALGHTV